jgi:hypothetical protein
MVNTVGVRQLSLCAAGITLASLIAFAQAPNGRGPGPVLGIVEIPETFFLDQDAGRYVPRAALTLYVRPDSEKDVLAVISSPEAIDDARYECESAGALVYGRQRGHFLIRTSRGVGWLSPHDAGEFHSLEELITKSGLPYLTDAWDGFVSASPGSAKRVSVPRPPYGGQDVRVSAVRSVAGRLWVQVEAISHSYCESQEPPTVKARGWITAHDETGAPKVWFPACGC